MTKPNWIVIIGRRWFERTNGNTYHSVCVWVDGEFVGGESFVYGYGDQYIQTAMTLLANCRYLNRPLDDKWPFTTWCRDNDIKLVYTVADVGRKKDL